MKKLMYLLLCSLILNTNFTQQNCGVLEDFKVSPIRNEASPILNVRLKFHILQKSTTDPQNFIDDATTRQALKDMVANINSFYRFLDDPTLPVLPPEQEVKDSRIQFILDDEDIVYVVDYNGWNRRFDESFNYSIIAAIDHITGTSPQSQLVETEFQFLGQVNPNQDERIRAVNVTDANGVVHSLDYIDGSVSYNGTTNISSIRAANYSNIDFNNSTNINLLIEKDKNLINDNYVAYGQSDPTHLHVFWTGGESSNQTGGGGGITSNNWVNMMFSYAYNGQPQWSTAQLLAHEIGHVLTLGHTNYPQFTDLPSNDEFCFCPCDISTEVSNNIMGYNMCRRYFSPLQIAAMRQYLSNGNGRVLIEQCTDFENQETIISENTIWNQTQIVPDNVVITNNTTLTINCTVYMSLGARFIVEPGSELKVMNAYITSLCENELWGGIDVHGNRYANQNSMNQGFVGLHSSTIERAYRGVRTIAVDNNGNQDWSKTGGIVWVNNATFLNCKKGIEFLSYHNFYVQNQPNEVANKSFIINSTFTSNSPHNSPVGIDLDAFISMFDVNGIVIRNNTFENTRHINPQAVPMNKKGRGIVSLDANYKLDGFISVHTGQPVPNSGNKFIHLADAVRVGSGSGRADVVIRYNDFFENVNGIVLEAGNYAEIHNNKIRTRPKNSIDFTFGIHTVGAYGYKIQENNFTNFSVTKSINIFTSNSSSVTSGQIYNNDMENKFYGVQTAFNNSALRFDCNDINKLVSGRIDFNHYSGEINRIGTAGTPANNVFTGTTCDALNKSQIYSVPTDISAPFNPSDPFNLNYLAKTGSVNISCHNLGTDYYSESTNPNACLSEVITVGDGVGPKVWSFKEKLGMIKTDVVQLKTILDAGDDQSLIDAIATQSTGVLKNTLMQTSPYLSDRVLNAYLNKGNLPHGHVKEVVIANSPVSADVKNTIDNMNLPNGIRNQINAAQTGISERAILELEIRAKNTERLNTIDDVVRIYLDTNWVDSAVVFLEQEGSMEAICALVPLEINRDTVKAKGHISVLRTQADAMESIDPYSEKAINIKGFCDFHEMMLQIKNRPGSYFDMSQRELLQLSEISRSNLTVAPNAQAILGFVSGNYRELIGYEVFFPKNMTPDEVESILLEENQSTLLMMPNPTAGLVNFELKNIDVANDSYELFITDMQGKLIKIIPLSNLSAYYEFLTEDQGVYLVHLLKNGERIETQKLVLTK